MNDDGESSGSRSRSVTPSKEGEGSSANGSPPQAVAQPGTSGPGSYYRQHTMNQSAHTCHSASELCLIIAPRLCSATITLWHGHGPSLFTIYRSPYVSRKASSSYLVGSAVGRRCPAGSSNVSYTASPWLLPSALPVRSSSWDATAPAHAPGLASRVHEPSAIWRSLPSARTAAAQR